VCGDRSGVLDHGVMETLTAERILAGLETAFVGRTLEYWPEIESTNARARRLAEGGAPEGTLVLTDYQTAGRGRLGRQWVAPVGSSLLMSLVFRPRIAPVQVQRLTMICGLAAVDAIESETGLEAGLKWPNDILTGGAKAGGILTEIGLRGDRVDYAVVGLGLNVNLDPARLPGELLMEATSLAHVLGESVPRLPLLWALLQAVETRYLALQSGHSPHNEWAERLVTLGRAVTVALGDGVVQGIAEGVDADGALLVRSADGGLRTVLAGDVTLRGQGQGHASPA
jgi:BirA family biotin operon repressor/biotin-[acetyl-CoA-carboxylase] ligase